MPTGAVSGGHARDYCQYGAQPTITPTLLKPMNVFWLPPDADYEAVYRLGGGRDELGLTVHSDFKINVPTLPVLFVCQIGLWVAVRYSEALPDKKRYCFHLEAQCAASLHELAKFVHGNATAGFCLAMPSHDKAHPGFFSPQQKALFNNYREARTNLKGALSNYRKAEIGRDQANALYLQTQKTWCQADGMLESIEESCRKAGFDPTRYLEDEANV